MSKVLIFLLTVFCFSCTAQESGTANSLKHNMTKEVLLDKIAKAADPQDVSKNWKTLVYKAEMIYPVRKIKVLITCKSKYPDKSKAVYQCPKMADVTEVVNGKQAWNETAGKGVRMKSGLELAFAEFALRRGNPALKPAEVYEKITLDPVLYQFGKYRCYRLICTLPEKLNVNPDELFVDNKEFLLRRLVSIQVADNKAVSIVRDFTSYKKIKGVKVAMQADIYIMGGKITQNVFFMEINEKIPDSEFELPKDK